MRECEILQSLSHPHIIQVYDIYNTEDTLYIVGLEIPNTIQNVRIQIYTIDGKLLQERMMSNSVQNSVDVSELASGTYIYTVIGENKKMHSGQFIKR